MQKEISNTYLYTGLFEYNGSLFIHQFHARAITLEALADTWVSLAIRKLLKNKEDKKELKDVLNKELNPLRSIRGNINTWIRFLFLSKDLGSVVIVKTAKNILGDSVYRKQYIWARYEYYKTTYEHLKNIMTKTLEIEKERKKYERLMRYWEQKRHITLSHQGKAKGLYTIVLEYNKDLFVYQFYILVDEEIKNVLKLWPKELKRDKTFDNGYEKDYDIISQRANEEAYRLTPVEGLVNVWSTYFMLSKGLGNIYVIKTDEEVMVEA